MEKVNYFTDKCPCGSGLLVKDCCLNKRENTIPKPPKTGYSNNMCFARSLNDCSEKISKEHFISDSVLKLINKKGSFEISKTHWIPDGESRTITRASLASHILCERHNSVLSPLDNFAKNFFSFLFDEEKKTKVKLINGLELERWMLKVFCGALASGNIIPNSRHWEPRKEWLDILFNKSYIPSNGGLYFVKGIFNAQRNEIGITLLSDDKTYAGISGLILYYSGLIFVFKTNEIRPKIIFPGYRISFSHRPEMIQLIYKDQNYVREIHFGNPIGENVYVEISKE